MRLPEDQGEKRNACWNQLSPLALPVQWTGFASRRECECTTMSPGMLHELQIIHAALGRLITLAEGEVSSPNSEADGDEIMALKPLRDMLDEARKGSVLENEESQRPKDAFDELPRIEGAILRTIAHNPTWTYAQVAERVKRQHPGSSPSEKSIADIVHEARKHPEKRNLLPPNRRHGRKY